MKIGRLPFSGMTTNRDIATLSTSLCAVDWAVCSRAVVVIIFIQLDQPVDGGGRGHSTISTVSSRRGGSLELGR